MSEEVQRYNTPVLGQEAIITGRGLGRVMGWNFIAPNNTVTVCLYVDDITRTYDAKNVKLVKIGETEPVLVYREPGDW